MKAKLETIWASMRASYWFVPAMMTAGAVALATATTNLDRGMSDDVVRSFGRIFAGGPEDARQLFNTVAGAMITVAGVTFSVAIVVLTLASQQFGPRLLYNFMRDTGTQVVLGTFVATFTYCLLVLRTVRATEQTKFVPQISATVTIGLALMSLAVLIYFIHHISSSIRVTNVIATASKDLLHSIDRFFPQELGEEPEPVEEEEQFDRSAMQGDGKRLLAAEDGYIQAVDNDELMAVAEKNDLVLRLDRSPGDFVVECGSLATVWPAEKVTKEVMDQIRTPIVVGPERTSTQDMEFSVSQIVEIAVRALSPGINDPATAVLCVDQLGVAMCRLVRRKIPSRHRIGNDGKLRVIAEPTRMSGFTRAAFDQIRQYGRTSVPVLRRLLQTIAVVAEHVRREEDRAELRRQAEIIRIASQEAIPDEADRAEVSEYYELATEALAGRRRV